MAAGLLDLTWGDLAAIRGLRSWLVQAWKGQGWRGDSDIIIASGRTHGAANGLGMNALLS